MQAHTGKQGRRRQEEPHYTCPEIKSDTITECKLGVVSPRLPEEIFRAVYSFLVNFCRIFPHFSADFSQFWSVSVSFSQSDDEASRHHPDLESDVAVRQARPHLSGLVGRLARQCHGSGKEAGNGRGPSIGLGSHRCQACIQPHRELSSVWGGARPHDGQAWPAWQYHHFNKEGKSAINLSNLRNFSQIWPRAIYLC